MLRRFVTGLIAAVTAVTALVFAFPDMKADALTFSPNCKVTSDAAILYNADVDAIVYEKNADKKELPAELAQIMTAVIVLEECEDIANTKMTAEQEMFDEFKKYEYPSDLRYANIKAGDELSVEDLLYAMMLTSSCEASTMLSIKFGSGSQSNFVEKMNKKAEALGMTNTRFTNATGLYSARQVSTAKDMLALLKYAMSLPRFERIACTASYVPPTAEARGKTKNWTWEHSNLMMFPDNDYTCTGVTGIKTGTLAEGGRAIAVKASRDGSNYLFISLNAPINNEKGKSEFFHLEDAKNVLEWAFKHLGFKEILAQDMELGEVTVNNAEGDGHVLLKPAKGFSCVWSDTFDPNTVQKIPDWPNQVDAPVQAGDVLGKLTLKYSGETLAVLDVVAATNARRSFWKYNLSEIPGFFKSKYLNATWIVATIITVIYIALCIVFRVRYNKIKKARQEAKIKK
ncbi:MAG: D-alanyl-D-alanine carboxypeptidase [Oscillospiraceae bacterium]|nr:D-alanyl-D-alanine carboxypeptidase [Oscillospiraceae bacterium]